MTRIMVDRIPIGEATEPTDERGREELWLAYLEAEWSQRHGDETMPAKLDTDPTWRYA